MVESLSNEKVDEERFMIQPPKAIGLFLCDQVVIDRDTQKPCLIGCFAGKAVEDFPSGPQKFDVFAALTDGLGDVIIDLTVTHLDMDQEIYSRQLPFRFPSPLKVVHLYFRVRTCEFPAPGNYLVTLAVGETEVASCRLRVYQQGE
jgi:hypothetical protein